MITKTNYNDYIIEWETIKIDILCRTVLISNRRIESCPKEFDTLCLMARHPGWVFTKGQIYEAVYRNTLSVDIDNIIYCLIYGLRKKLEENPKHPKYIRTVKGVGYKFVISEEPFDF